MNDEELDQMLDAWQAPGASPGLRRQVGAAFPAGERGRILGVPVRWIVAGVLMAGVAALAAEMLTGGPGVVGAIGAGSADTPSGPIYSRAMQLASPPISALRWQFKSSGMSFGGTKTGIRGSTWFANDRRAGPFYGVEFTADRLPDGRYLVKTDSLSLARLQRDSFQRQGPVVPLPENAGPRIVQEGKSFDIDVYRSGRTRVFARVWLGSTPFAMPGQSVTAPMTFEDAKLYRNGVLLADWGEGRASGVTMWFRLPGQGRYVMALDPDGNSDFAQAGQVNGKTLEITVGGDVYRVDSAKAIARGGLRPIYVWHDAGFESELKAGDQEVIFGSSGKTCVFNSGCK